MARHGVGLLQTRFGADKRCTDLHYKELAMNEIDLTASESLAGESGRRNRGAGGGAAARRQARTGIKPVSMPFITRKLEPTDILSAEAVEIIENNADILMEEVGELSRLLVRQYGEQTFKESDLGRDLADEMADVLWVLLCLANQTGVDLTAALEKNMEKKNDRDAGRFR